MEFYNMETCSFCKKEVIPEKFTTGYAIDNNGNKICFDCCGTENSRHMKYGSGIILYLVEKSGRYFVENWPGTLKIPVDHLKQGEHNIASIRNDVWFRYAGKHWHGIQYGETSQLCYCKVVK